MILERILNAALLLSIDLGNLLGVDGAQLQSALYLFIKKMGFVVSVGVG